MSRKEGEKRMKAKYELFKNGNPSGYWAEIKVKSRVDAEWLKGKTFTLNLKVINYGNEKK